MPWLAWRPVSSSRTRCAAALDHEEKRLPLHGVLARAQRSLATALTAVLARHRAALARDLESRLVRALHGYLTQSRPA
jgi:hypothetical protein